MTIVLYRYLMACKVDFSHRVGGKVLSRLLFRYTFILPLVLSISAIFFQDFLRDNLVCNGREEVLWYNLDNFFMKQEGGMLWYIYIMSMQITEGNGIFLLHFTHPFMLVTLIFGYAYLFMVPIGYIKVYKFLKQHNLNSTCKIHNSYRVSKKNLLLRYF